ncbi:MAG: phosphatase PAP2 family protein [Bacteroidota bacterium]
MKKLVLFIIIILSAGAICVPFACSKKIEGVTDNLSPLQPSNTDANAGSWKTILLTAPTEFPVAQPVATGTPEYIAQVNEIKSWQADITAEEKAAVKYWSAGAVLRWNEILRELVAKHNLAPYQNDDGTYPAPNANNALAYPLFPFSNPPYAARAYAYVSAAQYDALVAAYYYKKLYNRQAPYNADATVNALIPKTDLPSYPSEDAVVEGATVEMLKLLFPGDQEYVQQKAEEHKRARILAGANVRSDIEAGEVLGKMVAQKFSTRARGDRAGAAGGTQTMWTQMEADAVAKRQVPWYSLEFPRRPPMLCLFGKVKGFLLDSLAVLAVRPEAPPSTSSDQMKKDVAEVHEMIKQDSREHYRIVHYWADGVNTFTPTGHWNAIASADFIKKNFSEVRWARNLALLNMAQMDAAIVCWDTKYFYFNPRPTQMESDIKTLTGIPNFPSYISGHATFSGAAATVLGHIIPENAAIYTAMANEAAMSRLYAGIHYRIDSDSGMSTGIRVGSFAVLRAKTDGGE